MCPVPTLIVVLPEEGADATARAWLADGACVSSAASSTTTPTSAVRRRPRIRSVSLPDPPIETSPRHGTTAGRAVPCTLKVVP